MTYTVITGMESTMHEIDEQHAPSNMRENLKNEIDTLKHSIRSAQEVLDNSQEKGRTYTPVSPEKANELKRDVVFLKKDLENKKVQLKNLTEQE